MIPTVTPEWLTERLREMGALPSGSATGVWPGDPESDVLLPFEVLYSSDAPANAPRHLLIKANTKGDSYGECEARLYGDILTNESDPPVPPTYDVRFDAKTRNSYLLQEDLRPTHRLAVREDAPPTIDGIGAIVDQVARVHALCWNRSFIDEPLFVEPRNDIIAMSQATSSEGLRAATDEILRNQLPRLFKTAEDLPAEWLSTCRHAIERWPDLYTSRIATRNLTLIHADLHPWNVFVPIDGSGPPRIFDWELLCRGLGVYDVSYLIIRCRLDPETRREFEAAFIPRYHERLVTLGVSDYTLDACHEDYRFSIVPNILPPLAWQRPHNLVSTMEAFSDWDCGDLVGG